MPFAIEWIRQCSGEPEVRLISTPAGKLLVHTCNDVICQLDWVGLEGNWALNEGVETGQIAAKIKKYWDDPLADESLKLLRRGTPFQLKVWSELVKIRFGETITYKELAVRIGSAARAVGGACRANHFPLIIPCHRVVSVSGAGGYAGHRTGEFLSIKLKLLEYEKRLRNEHG